FCTVVFDKSSCINKIRTLMLKYPGWGVPFPKFLQNLPGVPFPPYRSAPHTLQNASHPPRRFMDPSAHTPYVFAAQIHKIWIMRVSDIPRDIGKAIRKLAADNKKHIPVHGWIEGLPFQNTLVPRGGGNYRMHVHSRIWRKLRIDAGAAVEVTMHLDTEPREAAVPPALAAELSATPRALATFHTLP